MNLLFRGNTKILGTGELAKSFEILPSNDDGRPKLFGGSQVILSRVIGKVIAASDYNSTPAFEKMSHVPKSTIEQKKEAMEKQKGLVQTHCVLEDEGICVEIYNFFWMKESKLHTCCNGLLIPETVIIKSGVIKSWFLCCQGKIVKKRKENCKLELLSQSFLNNKLDCGVVAIFLTSKNQKEVTKNQYETRYFDSKAFSAWLKGLSGNSETGILQKFIEPKSAHESIYKFQFSKDLTTSEVLTSKVPLNNKKHNIYERCALLTYNPRFVETKPLRSELVVFNIQELLETMMKHIFNTSLETFLLDSGTFFFKLDSKNRIIF
jgi:hypothetical protein